jgi:hypothetical protein
LDGPAILSVADVKELQSLAAGLPGPAGAAARRAGAALYEIVQLQVGARENSTRDRRAAEKRYELLRDTAARCFVDRHRELGLQRPPEY